MKCEICRREDAHPLYGGNCCENCAVDKWLNLGVIQGACKPKYFSSLRVNSYETHRMKAVKKMVAVQ